MIFIAVLSLFINSGAVLAEVGGEPVATTGESVAGKSTAKFENEGMVLEAAEVSLAGEGLIEATGNAVLTLKNSGLRIETLRLTYDPGSGIVKAPGLVKVINSRTVLTINSLTYDVKNNSGSGGVMEGVIAGTDDGRESKVTGESITLGKDSQVVWDTLVTRCLKSNPDYVLKARQVTIADKKIRLMKVVFYIKKIPVFYLPWVTLRTDRKRDFPEIQLSYDNTKGLVINEKSTSIINGRWDFHTDVFIETQGKSKVSLGVGYQFCNPLANHVFINNDLKGSWTVSDMVTYDTKSFLVVADGVVPLTSNNERQYGISITRKYWQGWGGQWQLGVLARSVSRLDETAVEYGGTYAGYQLDYKPTDSLILSVLRLDNYAGSGDYKDFEVYTGYNLMYDWTVPLSASINLNLSGRYNFSGTTYLSGTVYPEPQYWIRQKYGLIYNSCCWSVNLGWDQALKALDLGMVFKF